MSVKQIIGLFTTLIVAIVLLFSAGSMVETVEKGTYHIKQAAVSGVLTAHKAPGMYSQMFGDVEVWPNAETFFFTSSRDSEDDIDTDTSIEVRFNDGSMANISGTCRVILPVSPDSSTQLVDKHNYKSYKDLEQKAILPVVRAALRNTANLMGARESYSEKRNEFVSLSRDQIQNGIYVTEQYTSNVKDPLTDETVTKTYTRIKKGGDGKILREPNLLSSISVNLTNFEVKKFTYEKRVIVQITKQQEAKMAVATAKAQAQRAEQDALTEEAQGKAVVMKAKYQKEEEKIRAVVDAQKLKVVAVTNANRDKEVEALRADKAEMEAKRIKILADADLYAKEKQAQGRKALLVADGALEQKLKAWLASQKVWAEAYKVRKVPSVMMGGSNGGVGSNDDVSNFMKILGVKAANDLALDMNIKKKK